MGARGVRAATRAVSRNRSTLAKLSSVPRVVVVLPALNEEATIGDVVRGLPRATVSEVVVVDNGSTDATAARARAAGATVVSEPRRGYGSACLAGLAAARPAPDDLVALMDADGADAPEYLVRVLEPLVRGEADLVLGVRDPSLTERGAMTVQQRLGNALAVALLRTWVGARYSDLPPCKAMTGAALARLALSDTGFGFTIELLLRAHTESLRVREVAVPCRRRRGGSSKVSGTLRGTVGAGIAIVGAIARHAHRNRRPRAS